MLNSVVKISMMSTKYFEYYTIILRGAVFSWTHCISYRTAPFSMILSRGIYPYLPMAQLSHDQFWEVLFKN